MRITVALLLPLALLLGACATLPPPVSVDEALKLSQEGNSPDAIIEMMRASRSSYSLSASDILRLSKSGLPEPVLDYMQKTQIEAIRQEERLRQWSERGRWGWDWYRW
ncbi:hypothetical protein [Chitinimonas sp. BJB300]|uniref:hypothetical protein n=1 Tax=Chitinimonas sp. BJB300 TaxID=1559339 RepID=UPI000C112C5A|nr:hypothetical protein [Chitinimonas sp. BJB300]PHV09972.1 hypothetical protein CSQ89_18700 [Chitinimonas sp. BJB300]TSJ87187.1 hypothetical protein FG002_015560 [Chitinimonas sp. BJB300]